MSNCVSRSRAIFGTVCRVNSRFLAPKREGKFTKDVKNILFYLVFMGKYTPCSADLFLFYRFSLLNQAPWLSSRQQFIVQERLLGNKNIHIFSTRVVEKEKNKRYLQLARLGTHGNEKRKSSNRFTFLNAKCFPLLFSRQDKDDERRKKEMVPK